MISERILYKEKQRQIANYNAEYVVTKTLKNDRLNFVPHSLNAGFSSDPPRFMTALDERVEKLTTHRQTKFFKSLAKILKKQDSKFFTDLNKKTEYLTLNGEAFKNRLNSFNYRAKRLMVLATQNGVDLKRFIVK